MLSMCFIPSSIWMDGWDMKCTVDVCLNAYLIEKHSDRNCKRRILDNNNNNKNVHTHTVTHIHIQNERKLATRKSEATREERGRRESELGRYCEKEI